MFKIGTLFRNKFYGCDTFFEIKNVLISDNNVLKYHLEEVCESGLRFSGWFDEKMLLQGFQLYLPITKIWHDLNV
jgi:hypothetical protein